MSSGSKLARLEDDKVSASGCIPPTPGYKDIIVNSDPYLNLDLEIGSRDGMFQSQQTPYAHFIPYGFGHVPCRDTPEYSFAPVPLLEQCEGTVGGGHRHVHVGEGTGDDGSLAGTVGVPVGRSGAIIRGGMSASTPAPTRSFTVAAASTMRGGGFGPGVMAAAVGTGTGTDTSTGSGSGSGSGSAGAGAGVARYGAGAGVVSGPGGTGVIHGGGQGHRTSVLPTTAATSPTSESAGYSGKDGHPFSLHVDLDVDLDVGLDLPTSVTPRRHSQLNHLNQSQQHLLQPWGLSQNSPSQISVGDHTSTSTSTSCTGSFLPYEMVKQEEVDQDHLSQQDAVTTDFTPQIEVPLVGEKISSQAIAEQYASADPVFVAKTLALPQTYSHYRPILGDGNCGWRAIAFAYFEALVRHGDVAILERELQRVLELNHYIENVGGQNPVIFQDMVDETVEVFKDVITAMSGGNDPMRVLMARFNDVGIAPYLVYHLRLLAQSRMKETPEEYAPWVDGDVDEYISSTIMPVDKEIDHICLILVHDVLLKPANIVLEIAYLDRSEGAEVNVHRMPEEANGQDPSTLGSVITLLYRPGHYDLLYRDADLPVHAAPVPIVPEPVDLQVHRATYQSTEFQQIPALQDVYATDMSELAWIPGLAPEALGVSPFAPSSTTPSPGEQYSPSPAPSWNPPHYAHDGLSAPSPSQPSPPQPQATVHQLRFSKYNFPYLPEIAGENNKTHEPAYSTPTFKNSHFNTAHFSNMNFQPELYKPGSEEEVLSSGHGKPRGRKRSSDQCSGGGRKEK
ncbi:peptidase C65 Otubain-domain-containing protein [Xylariaceae sp. FL0594]|nr:peptidase C65 Otubain-domain-containing protein [Xylariaceae sp. FL0594]